MDSEALRMIRPVVDVVLRAAVQDPGPRVIDRGGDSIRVFLIKDGGSPVSTGFIEGADTHEDSKRDEDEPSQSSLRVRELRPVRQAD